MKPDTPKCCANCPPVVKKDPDSLWGMFSLDSGERAILAGVMPNPPSADPSGPVFNADLLPRTDAQVTLCKAICLACPRYTGTYCRMNSKSARDFIFFLRCGKCEANRW
jgi:hypothetical protein